MERIEAKKVLQTISLVSEECEECVREFFIEFIKKFPKYSYLARKIFRKRFGKELVNELRARSLIKEIIINVLRKHGMEIDKIILFGSRAKGQHKGESDWDVLVILKKDIDEKNRRAVFKEIIEKLSAFLIPCDIIIKTSKEIDFYKDFFGTVTFEALKEGIKL